MTSPNPKKATEEIVRPSKKRIPLAPKDVLVPNHKNDGGGMHSLSPLKPEAPRNIDGGTAASLLPGARNDGRGERRAQQHKPLRSPYC